MLNHPSSERPLLNQPSPQTETETNIELNLKGRAASLKRNKSIFEAGMDPMDQETKRKKSDCFLQSKTTCDRQQEDGSSNSMVEDPSSEIFASLALQQQKDIMPLFADTPLDIYRPQNEQAPTTSISRPNPQWGEMLRLRTKTAKSPAQNPHTPLDTSIIPDNKSEDIRSENRAQNTNKGGLSIAQANHPETLQERKHEWPANTPRIGLSSQYHPPGHHMIHGPSRLGPLKK